MTTEYILPTGSPAPPRLVLVDGITKSSCIVSWEPPVSDGGSPIIGYTVESCRDDSTVWTAVNKDVAAERKLLVTDLIEKSAYRFRVRSVNSVGTSDPSDASTPFAAKSTFSLPGQPGAPEVATITSHSATLNWSTPCDDGGTCITNYVVEQRKMGDEHWTVARTDAAVGETSTTIQKLDGFEEHEFRVTAENTVGRGLPSPPSKPAKFGNFIIFRLILIALKFQLNRRI